MPIGYAWTVALVSWGVACALTRWRWAGRFAALPALVVNELPFLAAYALIASTALAVAEGDLRTALGVASAAVALLALAGLGVVVGRALRAHAALGNVDPPRRPWGRILLSPFLSGRRGIVVVRNLAYGDDPRQRLDVYHRRGRPTGRPVLLQLHGGGFHGGDKAREALPLIRDLTSRAGCVVVSANYRLQPRVRLAQQVADVRAAIAWVRANSSEYGGDAGRLFLVGSSAGAYLAVAAVCDGERGIAGVIGRYGYYGDLAPGADGPPMLIVHGGKDLLVPAPDVRAFAGRAGASYAELPGAHHGFDRFESIRSAAVNEAVHAFVVSE
jgi:acetyl esterase/lipase